MAPRTTIQVVDPKTGEWTKLDLSKRPLVSLFCGNAAGGYGCAVNNIQDNMDKAVGTGVLLVPYGDLTPPAGSADRPAAPSEPREHKDKQREHSDSYETRRLTAGNH